MLIQTVYCFVCPFCPECGYQIRNISMLRDLRPGIPQVKELDDSCNAVEGVCGFFGVGSAHYVIVPEDDDIFPFELLRVLREPLAGASSVLAGYCIESQGMEGISILFALAYCNTLFRQIARHIEPVRNIAPAGFPAAFPVWSTPEKRLVLPPALPENRCTCFVPVVVDLDDFGTVFASGFGLAFSFLCEKGIHGDSEGLHDGLHATAGMAMQKGAAIFGFRD